MRRLILIFVSMIFVFVSVPVCTAEDNDYDPQHTMLALNMAIVSINSIVSTQDRIVLDQEYNNIINKLALGNIESDYELTGLFTEMMNFITGKTLRQEEAKRFQERYNRREQRQLIGALSGIRAYGGNLWSWLGSLATSCVSSYFTYQNSKAELLEGLDDDLWRLQKEDIEDCNDLQVRLLNSSWNLLRQYKLPDEYRLTQDSLNGYFKAVNEPDPAKRLRMLKARNVERNFQVYPPYWFYRAKAAQEIKDDAETLKCYDKFDEIWRPVLRYDPYKLEAEKYRVQALAAKENPDTAEIRKHLEIIRDYTQDGDWSNNLFAGIAYFLLGDKYEGISCVEPNVDFEFETTVSNVFLSEMKNGKLDAFALFALKDDIQEAIEKAQNQQTEVKTSNMPQQNEKTKRRNLTKEEIIRITTKYGFTVVDRASVSKYAFTYKDDNGVTKDAELCTMNEGGLLDGFFTGLSLGLRRLRCVYFYSHAVVTFSSGGDWSLSGSEETLSLSYDVLRDARPNISQLEEMFKGFDDNLFKALMELEELD